MLKANGARLHTHVNRAFGGNAVAGIYGLGVSALRSNFVRGNGALFNFAAGPHTVSGVTDKGAIPAGYRGTGAYVMARKAGGLSSHNETLPAATFSGAGAMGVNGAASFTASSSWTAVGQLVVSGVGSFAATASFSGNAIATLSASGAFTATSTYSAGITAKAWATGQFTPAYTGAGVLTATGSLVGSFPITQGGEALTADQVAAAVWAEISEGADSHADVLRIIRAATAGKSAVSGSTVTFRDAADTKDRITATVDGTGQRTAVTVDGT